MNYNTVILLLQLISAVRTLHSESCVEFGEVREVRKGRNTFPQVCDVTRGGASWLPICKNGWDRQDADVWCKQLGYIGSGNIGKKVKIHDRAVLKINNIQCNSTEHLRLVDCPNRKQTERCDYIADIRCMRCDRDTQCSGMGHCDTNSGKCKCTDNSTCEIGKMCKRERCECINVSCQLCQLECQNGGTCDTDSTCQCPPAYYGLTCQNSCQCENNGTCRGDGTCECPALSYGESCQHTSCALPCPEESQCNTKGECILKQTRLRTELILTSEHVTAGTIRYKKWSLTPVQKLILSVGISAGIFCITVVCVVSLSVCVISNIMHRNKRVARNENVYEDMAPLPSCTTQEYINDIVSISPYTVVDYDSVSGEETAPYYSTVRSESDIDIYDSIDSRFEEREYANICENTPIEPYLIA